MPLTRDEVLARIRAAFPPTRIDFKGALTGGLDEGAYRKHVDGKTWQELDREYVATRSDVLSFLEPKHLVAVLPVYLQSLVEDGTKTPVPDTLLLVLNRSTELRFDKIVKALDEAQRTVVVDALELFAASETGQPAEAARQARESWRNSC
ncbi:MAG: DUF6714 family protein [Kofleriaceae bacterium]